MVMEEKRLRINRKEFFAALHRDEDGHDAFEDTPYLDTESGKIHWLQNMGPNDLPSGYRPILENRGQSLLRGSSSAGENADDKLAKFFYDIDIEPEWY